MTTLAGRPKLMVGDPLSADGLEWSGFERREQVQAQPLLLLHVLDVRSDSGGGVLQHFMSTLVCVDRVVRVNDEQEVVFGEGLVVASQDDVTAGRADFGAGCDEIAFDGGDAVGLEGADVDVVVVGHFW